MTLMEFLGSDVFKNLSSAFLGIGAIIVGSWGAYFTKRKYDLEERMQKQREWADYKTIYENTLGAFECFYVMEELTDECWSAFMKSYNEAPLCVDAELMKYLHEAYNHLARVRFYAPKLNDEEEIQKHRDAIAWVRDQIDITLVGDEFRMRRIDAAFYPFTGRKL